MKQAILSFGKTDVLLVQLPEGATAQDSGCGAVLYWNKEYLREHDDGGAFYPFGLGSGKKLELLGKLSDLTEEQFAEIVDSHINSKGRGYKHYWKDNGFVPRGFNAMHSTACESFLSKMEAEGFDIICDPEPVREKGLMDDGLYTDWKTGNIKKYFIEIQEWRGNQTRTFPPDQTYVFIILKQQA